MKRVLITSLLLLALCFSLAACGGEAQETAGERLLSHGFSEQALLLTAEDSVEINRTGDLVLHSAASYKEVAAACYQLCKQAADDGEVRDSESGEPLAFSFVDVETTRFGYYRDGDLEVLAFGPIWSDQETGVTDYQLRWE